MNIAGVTNKKRSTFQWQKEGSEEHANLLIVAFFLLLPC